ncbi:Fpg/Nei family DNA glycosylase [Nocardioides sp. Kera G14]|uniref:Fpg/Nei family DNA glycosylase n=1 Tax=Nocardioides sp. Kera G14 TaxID=2884264 RepID=UPI001D0FB183|nr:DNA-formamidopyrimidine glycosylase family protein [Nocardioides sp. Kera G14]UDY23358.1 Fpg/Nei family DNA glycosylase [Nocardioides sp. Kera G14]
MPELPEVEALAQDLGRRLEGRAIGTVHLAQFAALKTFDPPLAALSGAFVDGVTRHGKFLDFSVGGLHLVTYLARAGWVQWRDVVPPTPPKPSSKSLIAARVVLDNEEGFDLTEAGTKKSLALYVVRSPLDVPRIATLGPDPLSASFTVDVLATILADAGRKQIKGVLRDQALIAGIGNAYSDEILWEAKLSPYKPADTVDAAELFAAIQSMLTDAVKRSEGLKASELKREKKSNLRVHAQTGKPCPRCGDTILSISFADSSLEYCPTCQTGGKPLADRRMSRLLK